MWHWEIDGKAGGGATGDPRMALAGAGIAVGLAFFGSLAVAGRWTAAAEA